MPQEVPLPGAGTLVRVRGDCWRVLDVTRHEDCAVCRLAGVRASHRDARRTLLWPFDRPVSLERRRDVRRASRRQWIRALRTLLLDTTTSFGLRAAAAGRFDLLPYQLEPALACLQGATRVLIADEVGLGKTVQAGLILAELTARGEAARSLVLAPAGLCGQWVAELQARFRLPAAHVDAAALRRLAGVSPPGLTPWMQVPLPVTSFDFLKQPEVLAGVSGLRWDAIVVDEAHLVALAPERARLVRLLASRSRRVILLTATPHAGDAAGFRALCDLGRLPGDGPILLFRRTRAALGVRRTRRVAVLRVVPSPAERRMHDALHRYARAVWRDAPSSDARLAMIVLSKRAASGPASLEASLARRLRWLSSPAQADPAGRQLQLPLPLGDRPEDAADEEPEDVLAAPGLRDPAAEKRALVHLLELARSAGRADRKTHVLRRLLARAREPAIVFTEYRDTLTRLADNLRPIAGVALLHGGLDQAARGEAVRDFTSGRTPLLLATDAAAHGLNLQARCRLVIDVDLPWMPARLEQRIGRVDRIGQPRRVHAVHLVARGTAEEAVLARLVSRIGRERLALGEADNPLGHAGEMEIARTVFEGAGCASDARAAAELPGVARREDLGAAADEERSRLEAWRRLGARATADQESRPPGRRAGPLWTIVRAGRTMASLPPGLLCLFVARFVDDRGSVVEEKPVVIHVALKEAVLARRSLTALLPGLVASCCFLLDRRAASFAESRLEELRTAIAPRAASLAARESALVVEPGASPLQPGLFDRRAARRAEEQQRQRAREAADAAARLRALSDAARVELAAAPELVLVLGVCL